jgi:hypothetical protein
LRADQTCAQLQNLSIARSSWDLQAFSGKEEEEEEEEDGDECDILDLMNVSLLFFNNFRTHQIPRHHEHCRRRKIFTISKRFK